MRTSARLLAVSLATAQSPEPAPLRDVADAPGQPVREQQAGQANLHRIAENSEHRVPSATYEANLRAIVGRMKKTGARLTRATTSPVPEGKLDPPCRHADVAIDGLDALAVSRLGEPRPPVNVHFTPDAYAELARPVEAPVLGR